MFLSFLFLAEYSPRLSEGFAPYLAGSVYFMLLFAGLLLDLVLLRRFLAVPLPWDNMAGRLGERPWFLKDALWLVLALASVQALAGAFYWLGVRHGWLPRAEKESAAALVQGILFHGLALFLVWIFMRSRGSSWDAAFGMNRRALRRAAGQGLVSYVGILPVIFTISLLYQLFLYAGGYPVTLQDVVEIFLEPQSGWSLLCLMTLAVVVAPIVEEILFRGILLPVLMRKAGLGTAVVVSSILFALIHQHLPSFIPLFVLSVALSLLYVYSGSLWGPIILHALFNGISICILLLVSA